MAEEVGFRLTCYPDATVLKVVKLPKLLILIYIYSLTFRLKLNNGLHFGAIRVQ